MSEYAVEPIGLPDLALPMRSLFTGYLLVVGVGLLMAGAQILCRGPK